MSGVDKRGLDMTQSANVVAFPSRNKILTVNNHDTSHCDANAIIDFAARREIAAAKAEVAAANEATRELTIADVWDAITENRVVMQYQPQYDMRTGKMVAAEALTRLKDINGNLIYPNRFIDLLEQSDLIVWLGRSVIEHVCSDLSDCRAAGYEIERIAINLSARQLNIDASLVDYIDQMIVEYGLAYSDLEFELTERQCLTPQCEGMEVLNLLAERGVRIVIDDFGVGYSSVVYLTELPISAFKLDRALIDRLPDDKAMQTLVRSLLNLANSLHLEVVAEGIENAAQNDYLMRAGCPYAQGFAYSKPLDIKDLRAFMDAGSQAADTGEVII